MPPKGKDSALETYIKKVRMDGDRQINNMLARQNRNNCNLLPEERIALRHPQERMDVIIKPADKGSMVVMLSKDDNIREADR